MLKSILPAAAFILGAIIQPVLSECRPISYTYCEPDRIVHYYDPDTGEICPNMDCGGGRAPPKTDKPGCPFYTGTELPKTEKSYLPCWTPSTSAITTTSAIPTSTGDIDTEVSTILGPLPTSLLPGSTQSGDESAGTRTSTSRRSLSTGESGSSTLETTQPPTVSDTLPAQGTQSSTTMTSTVPNSGNRPGFSDLGMAVAFAGGLIGGLL